MEKEQRWRGMGWRVGVRRGLAGKHGLYRRAWEQTWAATRDRRKSQQAACRSREQVASIVGAACRAGAWPRKTAMDCWVRADGMLGRAWVRWVQAGEAGWNMQVEGDGTLERARLHAEGLGRAWGVLQAGGCRGNPRHA